jgi:hypothetical protein
LFRINSQKADATTMAGTLRVYSYQVDSGGLAMRLKLHVNETELSLIVIAAFEIAFCLNAVGRRHCFELTADTGTTLLRLTAGKPCRAYLQKPGRCVEIPTDQVLPLLRESELPLIWPKGEQVIRNFLGVCE